MTPEAALIAAGFPIFALLVWTWTNDWEDLLHDD